MRTKLSEEKSGTVCDPWWRGDKNDSMLLEAAWAVGRNLPPFVLKKKE